jgi:uroporphyrinogen-III synthase
MRRSARRMELCARLHSAGARPVLEALLAVQSGEDLDYVLEDFGRIPADIYHVLGASHFNKPFVISGTSS